MEEIHYLLGNRCNLNCEFCFWDSRFPDSEWTLQKEIIDQISETGIKKVTLSGGEPTITNNFLKVLECMNSKQLDLILHTNGLIIDESLAKEISKYISRVSLTLDGSTKERFSIMRGNDKIFDNTLSLIKTFHNLGVPVNVKTLVSKPNKEDILNIGEILNKFPITHWSILEFNPLNRGETNKNKFSITRGEFNEIVTSISEKFPNIKLKIRRYKTQDKKYCFISSIGEIYTYDQNNGNVLMGNIKNSPLKQIIDKINNSQTL